MFVSVNGALTGLASKFLVDSFWVFVSFDRDVTRFLSKFFNDVVWMFVSKLIKRYPVTWPLSKFLVDAAWKSVSFGREPTRFSSKSLVNAVWMQCFYLAENCLWPQKYWLATQIFKYIFRLKILTVASNV